MSINQQLKKLMDVNQIGPTELGNLIGASKQQINGWVKEGKSIPNSMLERILNSYKEIDARWLITGKGSMLEEQKMNIVEEPQAFYGKELFERYSKLEREYGRLEEKLKQSEQKVAELSSGGSSQEAVKPGARAG